MSKKTALALAMLVACALPSTASAQFGIGVRAGTLGIGGEAAIGLGSHLAVRGGIGATGYSAKGTFSGKTYTVDFPKDIWSVGVDLYPGLGGLHLSAGMMHRPAFDVTGAYTGSAVIGGHTYNGDITLTANMTNEKETAPFFGIGFGRTTKRGLGFSLDLGAGMMGDGIITITDYTCQSGATNCKSQISQADVQAEANKVQTDLNEKPYAKIHPIVSLGLHFGLGK